MVDSPITWLVRSIHVFGAAVWLGGYVVMLLAVIPYLARERNELVRAIALATARVISIAGALTVIVGLVMISRSRGYGFLLVGEWGAIIISSIVLAVIMGAIGDAGLRDEEVVTALYLLVCSPATRGAGGPRSRTSRSGPGSRRSPAR